MEREAAGYRSALRKEQIEADVGSPTLLSTARGGSLGERGSRSAIGTFTSGSHPFQAATYATPRRAGGRERESERVRTHTRATVLSLARSLPPHPSLASYNRLSGRARAECYPRSDSFTLQPHGSDWSAESKAGPKHPLLEEYWAAGANPVLRLAKRRAGA